jgi:ankyrin repeat protein
MQILIQLGAGVTINERDCDGFTALQRFVLINDISSVKFLLEQEGLDLEAVTAEGRTALFLAAETRRLHIARELLRAGAYVHTSCRAGMTALIAASLRCVLDGVTPGEVVRNVQFWVEAGADIEAADGQCAWRALHYAAAGHYGTGTAAVKTLLRYNAQVTALTRFNQTPLMIAVCFGNTAVIPVLVAAEGASPSIPFESTEELQLNERVVSRRQEIARVLKSAQGWERYKLGWRRRLGLSDRTSRSALLWMGVGAGVGVGLVAVCVGAWLRFR